MTGRFQWHETAHVTPKVGSTVLGWWDQYHVKTILLRADNRWCDVDLVSYRRPPKYWTYLPSTPPVSQEERTA